MFESPFLDEDAIVEDLTKAELGAVFLDAVLIASKYTAYYKGEVQGLGPLIVDELMKKYKGGTPTAGYITYNYTNKRTHWWFEYKGVRIDPLCGAMFLSSDNPQHTKVHSNKKIFKQKVKKVEKYRVPDGLREV